jgi:choline-sulfatase
MRFAERSHGEAAVTRPRARFLASSGFAGAAAALGAGASEAIGLAGSPAQLAGAIGFVVIAAALPGMVLVGIARLLWRAWRPAELVAAARDPDTGGAPRVAAWAAFVVLAGAALGALTLQVMIAVTTATRAPAVHALAAPIAAVVLAALLVAVSRPAVDRLARLATAADRAWHRRTGRPLASPRLIAGGALLAVFALLLVAWFGAVRPLVGHFDLSFAPSLGLWLVLLAAAPAAWDRLARRGSGRAAIALAVAILLAVATASSAVWLRQRRPFDMLAVWGETQLAGLAIDAMFDLETLRDELKIVAIRPNKAGAQRDIVVVTIDTLRADRTPPYGGKASMPALQRLAEQGAVFDWAFAPGNVTRRSLPSIMLGVSAPRVRGRVAGWALRLDPRHVLVAERLRAAGYDTAGFFCCVSHFGAEHELGLIRGIDHVVIERRAEDLARQAGGWLAARTSRRPVFVWLHFIEPHGWENYPRPPGPAGRPDPRYDLALVDVDRALALVVESAWSRARRNRTYLLVGSDHGEALGEHGFRTHSSSLYNSEIRVPLIAVGPGIKPRRIARPVGLTDLAPTIMELAGLVPPAMPHMDGVSLAPLLRGKAADIAGAGEAYSAMIADRSVPVSQRAVIAGRYKLIWTEEGDRLELFDLSADPGERRDLSGSQPQLRAAMKARLDARRAQDEVSPF